MQDDAFRQIISAGWNVTSGGDVEGPFGHYAVVEIPFHQGEFDQLVDASELTSEQVGTLVRGYYFVAENSDGMMFLTTFNSLEGALDQWRQIDGFHLEWADQQDDN